MGDRNARESSEGSEVRFASYVEALAAVLGHPDRQQPMHDYCLGLLMPIERKSVEPMAAVMAPAQVAAKHQSLLHFVGNAPLSDTRAGQGGRVGTAGDHPQR
jgi:SRSO17 transposase